MKIDVETWTVDSFSSANIRGTLRISPEFQRRAVWSPKSEMLLVDSVARGVPIGALTLYADVTSGYTVYEVIDGKQRLTALMKYMQGDLKIRTSLIASAAMDDDEFDLDSDPIAQLFHDREYDELEVAQRNSFLEYKIPVFVVRGERSGAIRSFTRMNQNSYSLKPQEIRNAFFWDSEFLAASLAVTAELDAATSTDLETSSAFATMGVVSSDGFKRMQDVQLASELLLLVLQGPQHRRDQLDAFYDLYRSPSRDAMRTLAEAREEVIQLCAQIGQIFDNYSPLQAFHFPTACENDFYGIVGGLKEHGLLTVPQMSSLREELRDVVSGFRAQVDDFIQKARTGEIAPDEFSSLVESYGRGFLGGQLNSRSRRSERIRIWKEIIDGVAATLDPQAVFSEVQRQLIWARSTEKLCARCGEQVDWNEYHAGHKVARSVGGRTQVDNGQIEHARCNQSAGASSAEDI